MSDKILNESVLVEAEPLTGDELIATLLQDMMLGNPPSEAADDFINEFVLRDREETAQILALLETPSEGIVELLKSVVGQSYQVQMQALEDRGVSFVDGLKTEVRSKMTELANDTA